MPAHSPNQWALLWQPATDTPDLCPASATVRVEGVCPNASNPFHECSAYCAERWGIKLTDTSAGIAKVGSAPAPGVMGALSNATKDELDLFD